MDGFRTVQTVSNKRACDHLRRWPNKKATLIDRMAFVWGE